MANGPERDLTRISLQQATDDELRRLKDMPEDELLRASTSMDLFAIVESMRRLKLALHREERAIKWLTVVLVFLTVILVILTVFIVLPEIRALRH